MERRTERSDGVLRSGSIVDSRMSLALWLRAGRTDRGMSLDDVARVTKIQPRILERLEAGRLDGLPADVFVRGFVRSFARCVGLQETEALQRYAACASAASDPSTALGSAITAPAAAAALPGVAAAAVAIPESIPVAPAATAVGTSDLTPTVRALVEVMAQLVPDAAGAASLVPGAAEPSAAHAVEVIDLAAIAPLVPPAVPLASGTLQDLPVAPPAVPGYAAKLRGRRNKARDRRAGNSRFRIPRQILSIGTPADASPVVAAEPGPALPGAAESGPALSVPAPEGPAPSEVAALAALVVTESMAGGDDPIAGATWAPTMPPAAAPSVPWRKPAYAYAASTAAAAAAAPRLVIDDADPESAERVLAERAERADDHGPRRTFLPPILLDREDRSARQGGLTLAVIILLIAATLTLSYLMRRPSASGDGMTRAETSAIDLG
jgi:hypothetical protein